MYQLYVVSLGCSKNLVDTERMLARLIPYPLTITDTPEKAHIIFINTCGFINDAKDESINAIVEHAQYKQDGVCQILIVAGCLVKLHRDELAIELPEVDIFIDTSEDQMAQIGMFIEQKFPHLCADPERHTLAPAGGRLLTTPEYTAYLKIAEGCDNLCTYCVIPQIRGAYRSVPLESLVDEATALVAAGVRELVLISQDSIEYGIDLYGKRSLATLLKALCAIDGLVWIRVLYTYPNHFDEALIQTIRDEPKICKYLDIPIQHMSDTVLKRMGRNITGNDIRRLLQTLCAEIPDVSLRTTLMVGFPGESEADFQLLADFVNEGAFDHVGVFAYSDEEHAASRKLRGKVDPNTAQQRLTHLMQLQQVVSATRNQRHVGCRYPVLIEGLSDETDLLLQGRAPFQAPEVDGKVLINDGRAAIGDVVMVEITEALPYDLLGHIIDE
ncbi:30S ribosomal protein S12 methylthiotransferase RimO [Chrysiogenes arsenatis]|uniref:30S ribosomal protein S12 methylthiotransferase RimO n=1 Tax=Chrysiogenes arsenatis TaxID=309797 RepID=UPI000405571E|nr:30S ribosomal protein S12 methylthiotransferase RimO [Chrysiogenes arsenatis]